MREIKITKIIFYQNKIAFEKNNINKLYKTFDGLLNINTKTECLIHNESFANFFIDKINKMYMLGYPMQSAYNPYHNIEILLLNLTNYITHNIKNNRFIILIQLNLTANFDMINHQILFAKLQAIIIHKTII